jgi:catechol 2,3-dioxygenase-like lactoylglutathione lyase family enzyme
LIVALDHVRVAAPVGSERDARAFYGAILGLEAVEQPGFLAARGGVWFRVGEQELHVGVMDEFAPARKAHSAFRVSSVEELERLAERLEARGVSVARPDPDEIPGTARIHAFDPWGNRIELVAPDRPSVFI